MEGRHNEGRQKRDIGTWLWVPSLYFTDQMIISLSLSLSLSPLLSPLGFSCFSWF